MISGQTKNSVDWIVRRAVAGVALMCCMAGGQTAFAQFGFGFGNGFGVVGGISIDADGTVRNASLEERSGWLQEMRAGGSTCGRHGGWLRITHGLVVQVASRNSKIDRGSPKF